MKRPSTLKKSTDPKKKLKVKFQAEKLSNSSLLLEDSTNEEDYQYLKTNDEKSLFLTKVGLVFVIYSTIWVLTALYIINYPDESYSSYLHKRLHLTLFIFLAISCVIKMVFSFFGYFLRSFAKFVFVIDLFLSYFIILGLYYYLNDDLKTSFIAAGHYVLVSCFLIFSNSIAFFISSLFTHPRKIFNYYLGISLMSLSTIGTLYAFKINLPVLTMGVSKFYMIFIIASVVNVYICLNAFFIVNYRQKKFYRFEYIYCFMCFWADWFSNFWIDVVGGKKNAEVEEIESVKVSTDKESYNEKDFVNDLEPEIASQKGNLEIRS